MSPLRIPWLYGRRAAGAPPSRSPVGSSVAPPCLDRRRGDERLAVAGDRQVPGRRRAPDLRGGRRRLLERSIERPERRARSPTARSGGGSAGSAPGGAARGPGRRPRPRATGRWPTRARRPARAAPRTLSPEPNSLAKCSDVRRTTPGSPIAPPDQAANTAAVWAGIAGVTSTTPGARRLAAGGAGDAVESGDPLAAPLDQRGAAGEEERHVAAEAERDLDPRLVVQLRAPRLERGVDRCRGVAAATGEARRDGDRLLEAGRERRRLGDAARWTAARAADIALSTRLSSAGPGRTPSRGACRRRRPRRRPRSGGQRARAGPSPNGARGSRRGGGRRPRASG